MAKDGYPKPGAHTPEAKARREAHWRGILERWRASGLPKTEFACREQISADVLGWWQAEIRKRDLAQRRKSSASTAARARWRAPARRGRPPSSPYASSSRPRRHPRRRTRDWPATTPSGSGRASTRRPSSA